MTHLTKLRLVNFRNYADISFGIDARPVVLIGANGAGKTNVLEALSQFGAGRGLRGASLSDMSRINQGQGWIVSGHTGNDTHIGVGLEQTGANATKRILRIDTAPVRAGQLAEHIRMFWLIPAMDRLFATGASDRRRFFDRLVIAFNPSHGQYATQYEKGMRERNALLERPYPDPAWCDAVEARMAQAALPLAQARVNTLERLQDAMRTQQLDGFPKADMSLDGGIETALANEDADTVAASFRQCLAETRARDAKAGRTLTGPHRSDLIVHHAETGMPAKRASTGQQKAVLTAIILCASLTLKADTNSPDPLILLDEAGAHLDADRRAALFDALCSMQCQAWMTGTDSGFFHSLGTRAQAFNVCDGQIFDTVL